ncbi:M15 family metallopeptidase [Nocardia sp. NPDC020380]|uniref:M15 family metallopeptidase n=1 Tax=Nocardia sp. NPDC020380 TaxID=3364309 RepID=UPI00379E5113
MAAKAAPGVGRAAVAALLAGAGLVGVTATGTTAHARPAAAPARAITPAVAANGTPAGANTATAIAAGAEGLDPELAAAYGQAAAEAQSEGVTLSITSGYRTPGEQEWLWEDGIRTYGSAEAARHWVLPPDESTHVTGHAIDVGPRAGAQWLEDNGNRWGLCRMYDNEWWHFELATRPGEGCPARLPDASMR